MPAHSPPAEKPERRFLAPVLRYLPRAILNALMSLTVIALERRIRKALRSGPGPVRRTGR